MRAFVMKKIGSVALADKPSPRPGPNDAIVRTTRALVCTSDVHTVGGAIGQRSELTLGHEAVGVVAEVGSEVRDFRPGDRVVVGAITPDWGDGASQRGHPSQSHGALGGWMFANVKDGVFAELFHVNAADANLAHIPDEVPDEKAVYCSDMMSTGFAGAERASIPLGGSVAVFAAGPVGLMATAGARLLGAGTIIVVEGVGERQRLARSFGADHIVSPGDGHVVEEILAATDGEGVDSAVEALGSERTLDGAIRATRPGGTICSVGYYGEGETISFSRYGWGVGMSEKTITNVLCPGGRVRLERLLRLLQNGRVDPTPLTTHVFPFEEIGAAFEMMRTKSSNVIKPLIRFRSPR